MSKFFKLSAIAIAAIIFVACTNETEPIPESSIDSEITDEISELIVKYNGKTYQTKVAYRGDSAVYLDKEYAEIYRNEISKIENPAILAYSNDNDQKIVEYFHSAQELEECAKIKKVSEDFMIEQGNDPTAPITRGSNKVIPFIPNDGGIVTGTAQLWDDRNFSDRSIYIEATNKTYWTIPHLKSAADFNDKTSSIKVINKMNPNEYYSPHIEDAWLSGLPIRGSRLRICLICYHNINYGGSALYCLSKASGEIGEHAHINLKDIGWNDKISSLKMGMINMDEVESGKFTPHN